MSNTLPAETALNNLNKVAAALVSIGFTDAEAKRHLDQLSEIVIVQPVLEVLSEQGTKPSSPEKLDQLIKDKSSDQAFIQAVQTKALELTNDYLTEITQDLGEEEKKQFFAMIS